MTAAAHEQIWLQTVPTACDFGILKDTRRGPMVVSTGMKFSNASNVWLGSLRYARDFSRHAGLNTHHPVLGKYLQYDGPCIVTLSMCIHGWHKNPAQSAAARRRLERYAAPFFPAHPERTPVLHTLSQRFAELASGWNERSLNVSLRAIAPSWSDYVHFDPVSVFSAIGHMQGNATKHVKHDTAFIRTLKITDHFHKGHNHKLPKKEYGRIFQPGCQTLNSWRGGKGGRPSLHGVMGYSKEMRLMAMAMSFKHETEPADTEKPSISQRRRDCKNSGYFLAVF